jgi:hypothetical protein
VIALDKNNFECLVNVGNCYITWNRQDAATKWYLKASIVNNKSIVPLKALGNIYKSKANFPQAVIYFKKCL